MSDDAQEPTPVERGFFRETADGATVFFPWGLGSRGYVLPDVAAKRRARRAVSLVVGATLVIAAWVAQALEPLAESGPPALEDVARVAAWPAALLAAVLAGYALWASRLAERLPESDLRVSREERLREAAELGAPGKVALAGIVLAGMSLLVAWIDPRAAWLGVLGAVTGGALVVWSLALRRAAASAAEERRSPPAGPVR